MTSILLQTDVHYEAFDFHKECSKMRYERLALLRDQLANYNFGYFHKKGSVVGSNQVSFVSFQNYFSLYSIIFDEME